MFAQKKFVQNIVFAQTKLAQNMMFAQKKVFSKDDARLY